MGESAHRIRPISRPHNHDLKRRAGVR